ncbi:MAG: secondary thiamine-phosphate synthase enzyme YjbQ [Candidatus Heimdallarchaeaceae archaeon]
MVFQKVVEIETKKLYDFVNITEHVQQTVKESGIKNGIAFVNSMHNTAAVIIQEDDSSVHEDLIATLEKLVPTSAKYAHNYEGNVNATAHLKANLLGSSISVPVQNGEVVLGTWQQLWFVELFEARKRRMLITVVGSS